MLHHKRSTNRLTGCARPLSHGKMWEGQKPMCLGLPWRSFLSWYSKHAVQHRQYFLHTHIYIYMYKYIYIYTFLRSYIPKISKNHTDYIHTRKISQVISASIFFRYLLSNRTSTFAGTVHCIPKAFAKETPCVDLVSTLNYSK